MAIRDGFIIPNANTFAPDYQTSQPDQGDFLILGNSKYGVIQGAGVSLAAETATVAAGLVVIDNEVIRISSPLNVTIAGKGTNPRFDLVVVDSVNGVSVVSGEPSTNPVFPDVTNTVVVLAAIYIPASGGSTESHVIDKRNFLQQGLVSVDIDTLLRNYDADGSTVKVNIDGDGRISWDNDTHLERHSAGVLKITDGLRASNITVQNSLTVDGENVVTNATIDWGPVGLRPPSGNDVGDIWVDTSSGDISVYKPNPETSTNQWTTIATTMPTGTVITSFVSPENMDGWLPLWGQQLTEAEVGNLWGLFPDWKVTIGENTYMVLPDMRGRTAIGAGQIDAGSPGYINKTHGNRLDDKGTISFELTTGQLPSHSHRSSNVTSDAGSHTHTGATASSAGSHTHVVSSAGLHSHGIVDNGHSHYWNKGAPVVAVFPGVEADTCMDNIFNDLNHSYHTTIDLSSQVSTTGISISNGGSHSHTAANGGAHTHSVTIPSGGSHVHTLPEHSAVGGGQPVTFRPPSLSLYYYIKM